uniref:F-box/FBD/LRR-repeat protein At1g13570-like n=1 Tax=Erigeron canadensis TaxID=72917 RepID=UPI001CB8900E|nr:F-box/FBD/LRR-repeat protein At1g13570-like [Erigeron canadensis]
MKAQCLDLDRISSLPPDISEYILTLMPIKDALRTSILSRKWRYCWKTMPKLVFEGSLRDCGQSEMDKLVFALVLILIRHEGPIEELAISIDAYDSDMVAEFNDRIRYLSGTNKVKKLIFEPVGRYYYQLQPPFFCLQGLELLHLANCYFEHPLTFHGFSGLKSLEFFNVLINPQTFKRFLSDCPLLERICLTGQYQRRYQGLLRENTFTFVELLTCVPLIKTLQVEDDYMRYLATGGMPQKLPSSLIYLKHLYLDVCLMEQDEISSVLCMIRSSPNLEQISFRMFSSSEEFPVRKTTSMDLLDLRDDMSLNLDHLKNFTIENFGNLAIEINLLKLFLAKSPMLEGAWLELSSDVSVDEEVRLLRDLVQWPPYLRASPSAKLTVTRTTERLCQL